MCGLLKLEGRAAHASAVKQRCKLLLRHAWPRHHFPSHADCVGEARGLRCDFPERNVASHAVCVRGCERCEQHRDAVCPI
eukprot:305528-Rhodomonas_salina.3